MTTQSQSDFFGTGPRRGVVENPLATHDQRAAELGIELEPANPETPNTRFVITPPQLPPAAVDQSVLGIFAREVAAAEALVKQREIEHGAAVEAHAAAKQQRVVEPNQPWSLQALTLTRTGLDVAADDLDAVKQHRDQVVAKCKKLQGDGTIAAFEKADFDQGGETFMKLCTPFEKRAGKLGADMGKLVIDATAAASQILAARREAGRLARVLGLANYRDSGLDVGSFARRIGAAFSKGFVSAGNLPMIIKVWTGG